MAIATGAVDGGELPTPGTWQIDVSHTEIAFIGRHLGIGKVRGRFAGVDGRIQIAEDVARSRIEVAIDMASVNSGAENRDESLRSENWFDVTRFPTATFQSTAITADGLAGTVTGGLTIKGITRPVTLEIEHLGHARDPWGNIRAAFSAGTTISREDWGLTLPSVLGAGGALVSKDIRIEIETELVRSDDSLPTGS